METIMDPEFGTEDSSSMDPRIALLSDPYSISAALHGIFSGQFLAIKVRNWRTAEECERELDAIRSIKLDAYVQEPSLAKGGPTVFDFEGREDLAGSYYADARRWNPAMRERLRPYCTSADRLFSILAETFSEGVVPEKLHPGLVPCQVIVRHFRPGSFAGPHSDRTDFDWPSNLVAASQAGLLTALTYLSVADVGGELKIYPAKMESKQDFLMNRVPGSQYEIQRSVLPKNPICIQPEVGDLILFDARNLHEVLPIIAGERVTSSFFLAWRGAHNPLGRYA